MIIMVSPDMNVIHMFRRGRGGLGRVFLPWSKRRRARAGVDRERTEREML
jgi:hypothetical protein